MINLTKEIRFISSKERAAEVLKQQHQDVLESGFDAEIAPEYIVDNFDDVSESIREILLEKTKNGVLEAAWGEAVVCAFEVFVDAD
jgi:hypothetical protein